MKKTYLNCLLAAGLMFGLWGCSAETEKAKTDSKPVEQTDDPEGYKRDNSPGSREVISLEEAVIKKNNGEQFLLLFTKEGCETCESFNEVLDDYLKDHHLEVYEVSLSEADEMYNESDKEKMLEIAVGGVSRTPSFYWISSPDSVYMLAPSEANYSSDGLEAWVTDHQLDRAS